MRSNQGKSRGRPGKTKGRNSMRQNGDDVQQEVAAVTALYETVKNEELNCFDDYPLSKMTKNGLQKAGYKIPTDIQREAILAALRGADVLGAAKTGSGKTLAFVIPVLEHLWRQRWSAGFGLAALIVSPTRELALQTYDTIRRVGCFHDFSTGLIIGGTEVDTEKRVIGRCNLIVCTPGRLLQHMDENPQFDCFHVELLVLDEADRILELAFAGQVNAILSNLSPERQTLLFSATQTRAVKDLARLSLKNPVYVSAHEYSKFVTPDQLTQNYTVVADQDKMNFLWSFLRNHTRAKLLIFFSTCNQVRFVYQAFRHMKPGMTVLGLYGKLTLAKRLEVFEEFKRKHFAALFATDIAARGLDFPSVSWVVHMDCPVDVKEYIHRSGRTARYTNKGHALLLIAPHQLSLIQQLGAAKVPISEIKSVTGKLFSVEKKLASLCIRNLQLKEFAQKAVVSYVKSIYMMGNKDVFNVESLDLPAIAASMGLSSAPRIRYLERKLKAKDKKYTTAAVDFPPDHWQEDAKNNDIDFLVVKRKDVFNASTSVVELEPEEQQLPKAKKGVLTREMVAKKLLRKKRLLNKKIVFSDSEEDEEEEDVEVDLSNNEVESRLDIGEAKRRLQEADKVDILVHKEKISAKRRLIRLKQKVKDAEMRGKPVSKAVLAELGLAVEEEAAEVDDKGEEPDLSWLPDPDRLAGRQSGNSTDQETSPPPSPGPKKPKTVKQTEQLTLAQQENLALKLLEG